MATLGSPVLKIVPVPLLLLIEQAKDEMNALASHVRITFLELRNPLWNRRKINHETKVQIHQAVSSSKMISEMTSTSGRCKEIGSHQLVVPEDNTKNQMDRWHFKNIFNLDIRQLVFQCVYGVRC